METNKEGFSRAEGEGEEGGRGSPKGRQNKNQPKWATERKVQSGGRARGAGGAGLLG